MFTFQIVGIAIGCLVLKSMNKDPSVYGSGSGPVPARRVEYQPPSQKF